MTPSVKMNLVLLILLISLGINVYQLTLLKRCTTECYDMKDSCKMECCNTVDSLAEQGNDFSFCNNYGRFEGQKTIMGGMEIDSVTARNAAYDYYQKNQNNSNEYKTTGFILSKKVFDEVFSNGNWKVNAVRLDLALMNDRLTLIAKGIRRDSMITMTYNTPNKGRIFINQSMCPIDCLTRTAY